MPSYLFVYRSPEEYQPDPEAMAAWQSWFDELSEYIVDPGNPVFGNRRALGHDGCETLIRGYSVVSAADVDAAAQLAQGCPLLQRGGGVEIAEVTPLDPDAMTSATGKSTQAA
jgi:YCII-related domain